MIFVSMNYNMNVFFFKRPDIHLINAREDLPDVELDDVCLHPDIEKILDDNQWVDDAT